MIEELVKLKRSKRAKRVALRLDPKERIINLVIPEHMSPRKAYQFAQNHEDWIRETLDNLGQAIPFEHSQTLPFFGDTLSLDIVHDDTLKRTQIKHEGDQLIIRSYMENPANRIKHWLKKQAQKGLADIANEKAEQINKPLASVTVRDTKSRWGSCSNTGELSFSWRLIFAPYAAIDYVVAHEVAHRIHMDHSKAFWTLCEELSLNYTEGKNWMKQHGNDLMRYGAPTRAI